MSTGVFAVPTGEFVWGSVVWYRNVAGMPGGKAIEQAVAVAPPALRMVANAVTGVPGLVVRVFGRMDEKTVVPGFARLGSAAAVPVSIFTATLVPPTGLPP